LQPFTLLIKPAGPDCNLACQYCFYSGKSSLFGQGAHRMSEEVLGKLVSNYLGLKFTVNTFVWQGGEPTLMGLDFYKKVVRLQQEYCSGGQAVSNALQTNGVLLDDDWCKFLKKYNFLVGISLDGPEKYHDHYRTDKAGKGSFGRIMSAIENCRKHGVEFNILVLLNDKNVVSPDELFDFFVGQDIKYLQFIPCVEKEPGTAKIADFSIAPEQYGQFLCRIFDRWYEYGYEKLSIRIFDSMLNYLVQGAHSICTFNRRCADYIVIEHNGDAFCCDFFVEREYQLGNILDRPIGQLFQSDKRRQFAGEKNHIDNKCLVCRHNAICRGGCLKDRMVTDGDNIVCPSYFCQSYKQFFDYSIPRLSQLASKIVHK
jgi:uncharacterized protein